jgi:NTE family protein
MASTSMRRVAVACQGGGSHAAFTAGVLQGMLENLPEDVEIVALSGTSGGAMCAALAWDGLLRRDPKRACENLEAYWRDIAARDPWDQIVNHAMVATLGLRDVAVLPEVSPYAFPPAAEDRLRTVLLQYLKFDELRELARRPGAPALEIGAVEVLSGHFEIFTGKELCVEALLASAAIPELFRAIEVPGRGMYWDGLFSQNPPIKGLVEHQLDELWVIQINPSTRSAIPTQPHEIFDRRNQLAGNLAMVQELAFIESINKAIIRGALVDPKYRVIEVERIRLDRELNYRSKFDRRPELLLDLIHYGHAKWRWFLKDRASKNYAMSYRPASAPRSAPEHLPSE